MEPLIGILFGCAALGLLFDRPAKPSSRRSRRRIYRRFVNHQPTAQRLPFLRGDQ